MKPKSAKENEKILKIKIELREKWDNEDSCIEWQYIDTAIDEVIFSTQQSCEEKIKTLIKTNEALLETSINISNKTIEKLQQQNTELLDNLAVIKSENIILKAGREELKKDIEIDAREIKAVHKENTELNEAIVIKNNYIEKLKKENTELKEKLKELEGYQALRQGLLVKANKRNGGSLRFEK